MIHEILVRSICEEVVEIEAKTAKQACNLIKKRGYSGSNYTNPTGLDVQEVIDAEPYKRDESGDIGDDGYGISWGVKK